MWDTGTLSDGIHTIKIEWTGKKNPAATGSAIAVDAFDILGTPIQALVWNRYEQSDQRLLYLGTWSTVSGAGASGGSDKRCNTSSGSVTVTFTGRQLDWIATTGPEMSKADVSLDGGAAVTVDLFSADTLYQQKVWSTGMLTTGTHKLEISWNEENASGAYIDVDALEVLGSLPWSSSSDVHRDQVGGADGWPISPIDPARSTGSSTPRLVEPSSPSRSGKASPEMGSSARPYGLVCRRRVGRSRPGLEPQIPG